MDFRKSDGGSLSVLKKKRVSKTAGRGNTYNNKVERRAAQISSKWRRGGADLVVVELFILQLNKIPTVRTDDEYRIAYCTDG